jgi:hypothetical protein
VADDPTADRRHYRQLHRPIVPQRIHEGALLGAAEGFIVHSANRRRICRMFVANFDIHGSSCLGRRPKRDDRPATPTGGVRAPRRFNLVTLSCLGPGEGFLYETAKCLRQ